MKAPAVVIFRQGHGAKAARAVGYLHTQFGGQFRQRFQIIGLAPRADTNAFNGSFWNAMVL